MADDDERKVMAKKLDRTNKFQSRFSLDLNLNRPIFKIFSDYFNILKENTEMQKDHEIKVLGMIRDNEFKDTLNLYDNYGQKNIIIDYKGLVINCLFDIFKQNNEVSFYFYMSSSDKTYIDDEFFYDKIWAHAVNESDLKGSYFVMDRDEILWTKKDMEKRNFSDIYLPSSIIEDLKLYVATHTQTNKLMRYLMVGNPGTGKTESTLVLANELNAMGVTIIKTPVCTMIKEKVELASLLAPALIIFDDIDLSLGSRKNGAYSERLQDFLDVMDGTDKLLDNVGMIATTNSVALLDLAAQRPGRFDKVLSFDELTSDNIKNIILKSLKYNFKIESTSKIAALFTHEKIVRLFKETRVTGAHIFNGIKMLKSRMDLLKLKIDLEGIFNELNKEIKTIDKIRNADYLSDKLNSIRKSIGFNEDTEDEESEEEEYKREAGDDISESDSSRRTPRS
jgi:Holliday junction resolvasome RuvABC ATP-dependent DNA helicase subunit